MSDNISTSFPSLINPIAMPATGAEIGTPASIRASEAPHTVAIDEEPFDSRISETILRVYGNRSLPGIIGLIARSASAPCPISLRRGLRRGLASPTLKGGKL